jgi:hypothetical protein
VTGAVAGCSSATGPCIAGPFSREWPRPDNFDSRSRWQQTITSTVGAGQHGFCFATSPPNLVSRSSEHSIQETRNFASARAGAGWLFLFDDTNIRKRNTGYKISERRGEVVRLIVTGIDSDDRSTVVRIDPLPADHTSNLTRPAREGGIGGSIALWSTTEMPPGVKRPIVTPVHDVGCPPGNSIWRLSYWPPLAVAALHRTDTLSYCVLISGELCLVLESEKVELSPGDCVVMAGVMHGWEVGSSGAVLTTVQIGLEPV